MGRKEQIQSSRLQKIKELRSSGINPYPNKYDVKDFASQLQDKHKSLSSGEKSTKKAKIAGRILSSRDFGKIAFATLQDSSGKIQITLQEKSTPNKVRDFFKKYIDSGDFVGVEGIIFRTQRGELSILVKSLTLLTKSLLPLPEKWHGLQDKEERFRKRYLDLTMNRDVQEIFIKRARILSALRDFMNQNEFVEVETPLLQAVYGGANAKPFKTHIDVYNSDLFLSIAPELYLKKALVGGLGRVYEITKKFRNEGVDATHNPEHTSIEWYQAYADYNDGMKLFKEMMIFLAKELVSSTTINYQNHKIDLKTWTVLPLDKAIKKYLNEDITKITSEQQAKKIAKKHSLDPKGITQINLPDELLKLFRDKLIQPTFLTDYAIDSCPLSKAKPSDPTKAEIFQPYVAGLELARAYSELNDPQIQKSAFLQQEADRKKGNEEAMPTDMDFITALEHGMPPACGVGIGIERLTMLFTNQETIRDVTLFPFMKPLSSSKEKKKSKK
jgi:lysyl-tRNA synthetase, class II